MNVQVVVNQVEASRELRGWITTRLDEVLGSAVAGVSSIAVLMSPIAKQPGAAAMVRCSMVVNTSSGRRVVETRDANVDAAVERALRLVSLSLFAEEREPPGSFEKPAPLT